MKRNISQVDNVTDSASKVYHEEEHNIEIPVEIINHIISYVPWNDMSKVLRVNKLFFEIGYETMLKNGGTSALIKSIELGFVNYLVDFTKQPQAVDYDFAQVLRPVIVNQRAIDTIDPELFHSLVMKSHKCPPEWKIWNQTPILLIVLSMLCRRPAAKLLEYYVTTDCVNLFEYDCLAVLAASGYEELAFRIFFATERTSSERMGYVALLDEHRCCRHLFKEYVENDTFADVFNESPYLHMPAAVKCHNLPAFKKLMDVAKLSHHADEVQDQTISDIVWFLNLHVNSNTFINEAISVMLESSLVTSLDAFVDIAQHLDRWNVVSILLDNKHLNLKKLLKSGSTDWVGNPDWVATMIKTPASMEVWKKLINHPDYHPGEHAIVHVQLALQFHKHRSHFAEYDILEFLRTKECYKEALAHCNAL